MGLRSQARLEFVRGSCEGVPDEGGACSGAAGAKIFLKNKIVILFSTLVFKFVKLSVFTID